jgi:4-hydroxybenzoate polyprenyltransferase
LQKFANQKHMYNTLVKYCKNLTKPRTVKGLIHLTRYREYVVFVIVSTLFGFLFTNTKLTLSSILTLIIVLTANILAVGFSFMINDVEDADDDAINPDKKNRNPISAGLLSRKFGFLASFAVATASTIFFIPLGVVPFVLGIITLAFGLFYSWRLVRLKSIPGIDLIVHGLMLAGLQFACSYFSFHTFNGIELPWLIPVIMVTCISMYGELHNELRDLHYDTIAGITHTTAIVGKKLTQLLMYLVLSIAIGTLLYSIWIRLLPLGFIGIYAIVSPILLLKPILAARKGFEIQTVGSLQHPIMGVTAISLLIWLTLSSL